MERAQYPASEPSYLEAEGIDMEQSPSAHGRKVSIRPLPPARSPVIGMDVRTSVVSETANAAPAFHLNAANPALFTTGVRPLAGI